jgi:hypothetical protein
MLAKGKLQHILDGDQILIGCMIIIFFVIVLLKHLKNMQLNDTTMVIWVEKHISNEHLHNIRMDCE